jgi:5-methylcytosine-specific restriction endonuclease McrA
MLVQAKKTPFKRARDYLYNLEAMTSKEAKRLWRQSIRKAWDDKCAYCGQPPIDEKSLTLDHVKPKSKGGEDLTANCVPACRECNHSKGSMEWKEWFSTQDFYSEAAESRIIKWLNSDLNNILDDV